MNLTAQTTTTPEGRTLTYAEWGEPRGRSVFSLHGTPGCRLFTARRLEHDLDGLLRRREVRLITYDRPGYARSDRDKGLGFADTAADVRLLRTRLASKSSRLRADQAAALTRSRSPLCLSRVCGA